MPLIAVIVEGLPVQVNENVNGVPILILSRPPPLSTCSIFPKHHRVSPTWCHTCIIIGLTVWFLQLVCPGSRNKCLAGIWFDVRPTSNSLWHRLLLLCYDQVLINGPVSKISWSILETVRDSSLQAEPKKFLLSPLYTSAGLKRV